jgi:hypothetical protein
MKIKNEKELQKILDGYITIPVYWTEQEINHERVLIDEESMREEFENKLKEIVEAVNNY